jgi:hypothetical protein
MAAAADAFLSGLLRLLESVRSMRRSIGFAVYGASFALVMIVAMLTLMELVSRRVDRLPLFTWRLPQTTRAATPVASSRDTADRKYLADIRLADGVRADWYDHNPPAHAQIPLTPELAARYEHYRAIDPYGAFYAWNRAGLREALCDKNAAPPWSVYDDFYVFDGTSTNPPYRMLPHIQPPGWFPTNRFGWRGPDVPLNKPTGVIRIAFLGSSKTIDPFGEPFSHIEYIGEWLNLWLSARGYPYRVEVVNAARTGISEVAIAATLEEVLPLEPDLVIDEGGNDFSAAQLVHFGKGVQRPARLAAQPPAWASEQYSALARRVHRATVRLQHLDGSEPVKPSGTVDWNGADEFHPDITRATLPMGLHQQLAYYDTMRTAVEAAGGRFALRSWVFMARDGLRLDLTRDLTLFTSLNWTYYPLSYSQLSRARDFYNRVFRAYADTHHMPFFDLAAVAPSDPELFGDAVHMTRQGLRLESWNYLQMLVPWIDGAIRRGALPRPMQHPRDRHPAFPDHSYDLVTRAELQRSCP